MDVCSKYPKFYHIGLPKTGTTTLQTVLKRDKRVNCIRNRYFNTHQWWTEDYDYCSNDERHVDIVSEENIVLQSGNLGKFINTLYRIKKVRPDAHIILTIREQRKLLESRYKFNIPHAKGFVLSFEDWLKSGQGMDLLSVCLYENIYQVIRLYFPGDQIHFLLFEELENASNAFFSDFYNILGLDVPENNIRIKENVSPTESELCASMFLNRFKFFTGNSQLSWFKGKIYRHAARLFKNENKKLDCFRWKTSRLFTNIEKDFAETNQKLVTLGIFTREKLMGHGYLL